jgi:hypothetical protein
MGWAFSTSIVCHFVVSCVIFGLLFISSFADCLPIDAVGGVDSWVAGFAGLLPVVAVGVADILSESGFSGL